MDPADKNHLQRAVSSQGALLGQHDQQLRRIEKGDVCYTQQLSQVGDTLKALCSHVTLSAASPEPSMWTTVSVSGGERENRNQHPLPRTFRTPPLLESPVSPGISSSVPPEAPAEPMELARARLSPTERQRRFQAAPFPKCRSPPTDTSPTLDMSLIPPAYHDIAPVFNKEKALSLPPHRPFNCAIDLLAGAPLPTGRLYNLSRPEREAMEKYIRESLQAGLIRPSSSPGPAGFFFVSKKDKTLRLCIDYGGLNNITIKNKYPLPLLNFESLQDAAIFTKLDLRNAYHLVQIREGDKWKTAFNTPLGQFEYLVIPFGLTNAPAVFQSLINSVLRDFIYRFVFVYLDDILIFSRNLHEHQQHVWQVLQRLLENRLFVKAEKCEFHVKTVSFLGFIIGEGEVRPDPEKTRAVTEWPRPGTRKQLQRFLGFTNFYRRFIKNYSTVAAPLTKLTSPVAPFHWTEKAEGAFTRLNELFTSPPILSQPDTSRQFIVEVDASEIGVGAVLSERSEGRPEAAALRLLLTSIIPCGEELFCG
ncbi:hypothetical protein Q8A73_009659 [Channa argus]|nr:hypothetical protein Q8A73_009659 [Channa argus]